MPTYHTYRIFISYLFKLIFITFMKKLLLFLVGFYALFSALPANAALFYSVKESSAYSFDVKYAWSWGTDVNGTAIPVTYLSTDGAKTYVHVYQADASLNKVIYRDNNGTSGEDWKDNQKTVEGTVSDGGINYIFSGSPWGLSCTSHYNKWQLNINGTSHDMTRSGDVYTVTTNVLGSGTLYLNFYINNNGTNLNFKMKANGLTASNHSSIAEAEGTSSHSLAAGNYTFTFNPISKELSAVYNGSIVEEEVIVIPTEVNMPLKPADFANGKAHYFIVGTRMSEWRLQPEWELTVSEDGTTATIDDRLFYNGRIAIAKVDNYTDYINHRYTLFTNNQNWHVKKDATSNINLYNYGTKSCVRYSNKNTDQVTPSDGLWFTYDRGLNTGSDDAVLKCHPTYVKQVVVNLSNGTPSKISFNDVTNNLSDLNLNNEYTFSLVGSNIGYDGYTDQNALKTPLEAQSYFDVKNWQESWIQYDPETGEPYIDGNGDAIYQTCFQKSWLVNHPTKFRDASGEKPFEYSSRSITFTNVNSYTDAELNADPYRDLYARYAVLYDDNGNKIANTGSDNSIGNDTDEYLYRPNGDMSDTYLTDKDKTTRTANWQCFVVKDMWMSQQFKVWTGWGGANKTYDESGTNSKDARWYYENGGHDIENRKYPVKASSKNDRFYATWRDRPGADFQIGNGSERVYFKRVIVWYNPTFNNWDGDYPGGTFENSVIQLITELGGPNIYIGREDKNHLHYTYSIPEENDELANVKVKEYYIYRFMVDETGNEIEGTRILVKSETGLTEDPEYVAGNAVIDANEVSAGTYKYEIAVVYHGNDAAAIEEGTTRIAYSNEISIYEASVPVTATAVQQRDNEGRYSFNIELNANIKSSALDKTTTNGKAVKDLAKYYTVVVTDETLTLLNASTSIEADGAAKSFAKGNVKVADAGEVKTLSNVNYMQFNVPTGDAKDMPTVVFHNIDPSKTYPFDVYLTSEDGDIDDFAQLNFDVAKTTATLVIPAPTIEFENVTLKVHGIDLDGETDPSLMPLGSHRYLGTWQNPKIGLTDPIHYRGVNYATTTGAISALNVTDEVVNNWAISYDININGTYAYNNEVNSLKDANNHINNTVATLEYFPIDFATEAVAAENAKDGRAYTTYNNAKEDYLAGITANYSRSNISASSVGNEKTFSYTPAFEGMVIKSEDVQNCALMYDAGSHYFKNNVYHAHSYDALMQVSWTLDNELHKYIGIYADAQGMDCAGHYIKPNDGYWHMYIPSTVLTDASVNEYNKPTLASIAYNAYNGEYSDDNNWALLATKNNHMPIKVHNVWSGNTTINSDAKIDITTTTNYPVLVMTQPSMTIGNAQVAANEAPTLKVIAIPATTTVTLNSANVFALTGVEDILIEADSDARYYNLQGVEVEKPSNGVYIMVKGQKATKVFIK